MMGKLWRTAATTLAVLTATAAQAGEADRPDALVLSGRIIDGSGAAPIPHGRVVAIDGVITCVGKAADCAAPPGAVFIDAGEGSIMPGLIDLHRSLMAGSS
jgi:imidazolonepropionase-like amidohydrolase